MKQIIGRLKTIGLRQIITIFLATMTFLVVPAFNSSTSLQAQAATPTVGSDFKSADPDIDAGTVRRIQEKAEDLGDRPEKRIGDTGLENIKQLGESIPKTIDLNVRQAGSAYNPKEVNRKEAMDRNQANIGKNAPK
jgi:hypothetical protein